ncbi:MAG TPA: WXG100 family type VII secretion target, partial [Solirubrobacteraceae bacterium]|nr:WXG100 family type VII secretion target [Solirubrobacteraceae bacterium]
MPEISIPGSPGGLQALAGQLRAAAAGVESVRGRVDSNGLHGSWSGRASDAFRSTLHELPGELSPIASAFGDAAQALGTFAARLTSLQEQARWCEQQMSDAQQELRTANARHDAARAKLTAAQRAHSTATDPVSLSTAQSAVHAGEGLVRQAQADIEDISGGIGQIRSRAQNIRDEYDDAVRVCCSALDAARHAGGRSLVGWVERQMGQLVGHVGHGVAAFWGRLGQLAHEAEDDTLQVFDLAWPGVREALSITSEALGDATLIVCGAGLVVAGGVALTGVGAVPAALIAVADVEVFEKMGEVTEVESVLILEGDAIEARRGHEEYRRELPSDVVGAIPSEKLFRPLKGPAKSALRSVTHSFPGIK